MTDQAAPLHRFYDRFDLLFYVTVATVALLLLVDLDQDQGFSDVGMGSVPLRETAVVMYAYDKGINYFDTAEATEITT